MMMQMNSSQQNTAVPFKSTQQIQTDVKEALQFIMGNSSPEMLDEMSTIFMNDALLLLNQIKIGYSNQDYKSIDLAAHTLKGSSATIGLQDFADLCLAIEQCNHQQQSNQLANHIANLELAYAQINRALMAFQI